MVCLPALLDLKQVVSALIGAVIALSGQYVVHRFGRARTGRRLALAFWEELSAVNFYGGPSSPPNFAGFSAQTFDSLFREVAETLPESLARDLMRYHWRMKYLEEAKTVTIPSSGGVHPKFWAESKDLHDRLLPRLDRYSQRSVLGVALHQGELT